MLDQYVVLEKNELQSIFKRLEQADKDGGKLGDLEVAQAVLGGAVGGGGVQQARGEVVLPPVEVDVSGRICEIVHSRLQVLQQPKAKGAGCKPNYANIPIYSRPIIERCIEKLADELESIVLCEIFEAAVIHDGRVLVGFSILVFCFPGRPRVLHEGATLCLNFREVLQSDPRGWKTGLL